MMKVMLVDDEPWNREIIRVFGQWEQNGMTIIAEAENGQDAIMKLQQEEPQLIITDMKMPGVDGTGLMEYLSVNYPHIFIIVVSGYDDFDYARKAIRFKAMEYLLKPIDAKELNEVLLKCKELWLQSTESSVESMLDVELSYTFHSYQEKVESIFDMLDIEGLAAWFKQVEGDFAAVPVSLNMLHKMADQWNNILQKQIDIHGIQADIASWNDSIEDMEGLLSNVYAQYEAVLKQFIIQRKYKNKLQIQQVQKYIESHVFETIMLDDLAKRFYVSKEYISKIFKSEYGISITDYILQLRMEQAHSLLLLGELPIKEIAEKVGYDDISYFYRVFRKHFGFAPGEVRKNNSLK